MVVALNCYFPCECEDVSLSYLSVGFEASSLPLKISCLPLLQLKFPNSSFHSLDWVLIQTVLLALQSTVLVSSSGPKTKILCTNTLKMSLTILLTKNGLIQDEVFKISAERVLLSAFGVRAL